MRLSLGILAWNSAQYIEKLLRAGREFADEIVVGVDSSSIDATEEICRNYADKLFRLEPIGTSERALPWLTEECTGDWILRLDHDELPSLGFIRALPRLMEDREVTHYWLPRRWIVNQETPMVISQPPWWPDWQLRLYRNVRSLVSYPGHLHSDYVVQGAPGYFSEGSIYHYDLVYHSEERRKEKLSQYESISPGNSLPNFYFPDLTKLTTRPFPIDDPPWEASSILRQRPPGENSGIIPSSRGKLADEPPFISLAEMRRRARLACDYTSNLFRATLDCLDCPEKMTAELQIPIEVQLRNDSEDVWSAPGLGIPEVRVSYHWLGPTGEMYYYEGIRTDLPLSLRPGESTKLIAPVLAPLEPGDYLLHWDLVIENVSWFSTQGWQGPKVNVHVESGGGTDGDSQSAKEYLRLSQDIPGWIRGNEARAVLNASYSLPQNAVIVEIGSFLGSSSVLLAGGRQMAGSGTVHCIDPFDCSGDTFSVPVYEGILASAGGGSLRDRFDENIRRAGLETLVEIHQGGAAEIAAGWSSPIDMLFLDGDQSRKGARLAYESWSPFLKPGGIIAVHNTEPRVYAEDHDGNRILALDEIHPPQYTDTRLIGATTFARKAERVGGHGGS